MRIRYDMKKLPNGQWCVYDIFTGIVAKHNGAQVIGLNISETDKMVNLLNKRDAEKCPNLKPKVTYH
ncbi:hypothetical protein [Pseudochrobactrum kiredjianiae]|uniref:Uncharacterized protein n=1 Tax=Pseudochrobactrum kiredjianiae TaxID=386305 RepID=A0ABW3V3E3_9HYPH|nr:hypothetical protein [Pseudochrobactrum kiredjianiae]MDM7851154.1 hypothetical protein [Pseudochrobactrum kiredjianiae]